MKNPLQYQITEYDCGPTSLLNGMSYLFEREQIPPDLIRNIMLYCLDCYGSEGAPGKSGTSCTAMMFLSNWLNGFGSVGTLPISSTYIHGKQVSIHQDSAICHALCTGGAAVVRLYHDVAHYVLLTGIQDEAVLLFDPYYQTQPFPDSDVVVTMGQPHWYNRVVPFSHLNRETKELYALGSNSEREAVLLFNEQTRLTAEKTIEYFI